MKRFVRNDARIYHLSLCRHCGTAGGCGEHGCETVTCLWCGTPQCSSNGLGNGRCAVCHHGYLPNWHRSEPGQACSYKGCREPAVGVFPRKGRQCAAHGARNLPEGYLEDCLALRAKMWHAIEVDQ